MPHIDECFGLTPYNSIIQFEEGFIRYGYDVSVEPATRECLFEEYVYKIKQAEDTRQEDIDK